MNGEYRSVHFDLDTKAMKRATGSSTKGYRQLKRSFEKFGFSHRQGSGYRSNNPMDKDEATVFVEKFGAENSWLADCLKSFEMTNSGASDYDFTEPLRDAARVAAQAKQKNVTGENKPQSGFSKGLTEMFESRPTERVASSGQEKVASSQNVME